MTLGAVRASLVGLAFIGLQYPSLLHAQDRPMDAEAAFAEAFERYTSGLYEAAAQSFAEFREVWPTHPSAPEALYYQAGSTLGNGNDEEAIDLFKTFRDLHPRHPLASEARLTLGTWFFEAQEYPRAIETLSVVADEKGMPETAAKALYWMGESAMQIDDLALAESYYLRAATDYPSTETAPVALYAIAYHHVNLRNYAEAVEAFELLTARYPNSEYVAAMGLALAEAYYEVGDYQRAVDEIERRINRLDKDSQERATFLLAESYNQLRESDQAIVYYRRFTSDNSDSPFHRQALYGLGWNYHFEGVYEWAAEQFELAKRGNNDDLAHKAAYYEGVNLALAVQSRQAAKVFEELIAMWPRGELTGHAWIEMGMARYALRQWQGAADAFEGYTINFPGGPRFGEANRMLGEALVATGDFNGAFDAYDAAIIARAAPQELRDQVAFQKAWLQYRSGRYKDAGPAFMAIYRMDPTGPQAGDALFWGAEAQYQSGLYSRATRLFSQYIRDFPGHRQVTAAHYALGWSYFRQRQYGGATLEFQRFLGRYSGDPQLELYARDARIRLADSYFAMKQYGEAVRAYRKVEGEERDYALFQAGQALTNAERSGEAIAAFEELRTKHPFSQWTEQAAYAIAYLKFLDQDYDAAIEEYEKIVERNRGREIAARSQYGIADSYYNSQRWDESETAYRTVLAEYPESDLLIDAVGGLQYALYAQGKDAEAENVVAVFAEEHPDAAILDELRLRQAELTFGNGDLESAILQFHVFLATASGREFFPDAFNYLGQAHADLGHNDSASVYLGRVVSEYPNHPLSIEAGQRLGSIYIEQDDNGLALRLYRTLARQAGSNETAKTEARYGEGMALVGLGRTEDAAVLFNAMLDEDPTAYERVRAMLGLARVYETSGRPAEATSHYRQVMRASQGEPGAEALCRMGELLIQTGQPDEALEELGRLAVLYPSFTEWQARGYLAQAHAHLAMGEKGEASRVYDIITTRYPDTRYATMAVREKKTL